MSFMKARAVALVSRQGSVVEMWRVKPEADHVRLREQADRFAPDGAPHQWVVMAPTGEYA